MEFIKSLVSPLKMKRYTTMSMFLSLLIFAVSMYLFTFSYKVKTNSQKQQLINDNTLEVLGLYEINDPSFDYKAIKDYGYGIKGEKLTTSSDEQVITNHQVTYTKDGVTKVINILFDPYDIREKDINAIKEQYYNKYNIEEPNKTQQTFAYYISNMVYVEKKVNPNLDVNEYMDTLNKKSLGDLEEEAKNYTIFDLFQIETVENAMNYAVVFNPTYIVYGAKSASEDQKVAATIYYLKDLEISFSDLPSIAEFGQTTARIIIDTYVNTLQMKQVLNYVLTVIVMPFFLVFIIWIFYRRNSVLKTYKEYYNIAAVSSIVPTILIFIVSWFWTNVYVIHAACILVYYVYVLYRINSQSNNDPQVVTN